MEPFFFGGVAPTALFGAYHAPPGGLAEGAVLLCPPVGHEYVRSHRALRNLGIQLSRSGASVLRFDYLGLGDSGGDMGDARVEQWIADIGAAGDELRRRSGRSSLVLVGLRLGAVLAAAAARHRADVARLVLWDPVLSGREYLEELTALQQAWLRDRLGAAADSVDVAGELLGMPLGDELRREMAALDVRACALRPTVEVDIVTSVPRADCEAWARELAAAGVRATHHVVPSAGDWHNPEAVHQLLLPHEILRHLGETITRRDVP
jgi:pimeloyl-ACP methyl ester carboxylesterase